MQVEEREGGRRRGAGPASAPLHHRVPVLRRAGLAPMCLAPASHYSTTSAKITALYP
jgi:hypothetical protein